VVGLYFADWRYIQNSHHCKNSNFTVFLYGGNYSSTHWRFETLVFQLVLTANIFPTSLKLFTLMKEVILFRNVGFYKSHKATRYNIPEISLFAACVVPSSAIFVTLMKETPGSSETSVLTRATRRNNPADNLLYIPSNRWFLQ
jgi:hypothetical protein